MYRHLFTRITQHRGVTVGNSLRPAAPGGSRICVHCSDTLLALCKDIFEVLRVSSILDTEICESTYNYKLKLSIYSLSSSTRSSILG